MRISCGRCGTSYQVDESRIPPGGLTMRCSQCQSPIQVRGAASAPPPAAPSKDARYYLQRRTGKVFGPFLVQAIASMLEQGKLEGDEQVSTNGETWMSMAQVPELAAYAKGGAPPPRPAAPPPSRPAAPPSRPAAPPIDDLPAPKGMSLRPTMPADHGLADLPAPRDHGLADLPAPKGAIIPPPPAAGGFDLGDFDQQPAGPKMGEIDLGVDDGLADLPAPKQGVADLPAPKMPGRAVPPGPASAPPGFSPFADDDLADLPAPKQGVTDLPAPKAPAPPPPGFGQIDLGGDDGFADLPAPKHGISDLPAPKAPMPPPGAPAPPPPGFAPTGGEVTGLPAPKEGVSGLPMPKEGVSGLPVPKEGISGLPTPKHPGPQAGTAPAGVVDLPQPKTGMEYGQLDLGGDAPGLDDLPMPAAASGGLELDSDFDLPTPKQGLGFEPDAPDLMAPRGDFGPDAADVVAPKDGAMPIAFDEPVSRFAPPPSQEAAEEMPYEEAAPIAPDEMEVIERPGLLKRRMVMIGAGAVSFILVVGIALGLLTDFGFFGLRLLTGSYSSTKEAKNLVTSGRRALREDTAKAYFRAATDFEQAARKLSDDPEPLALQAQSVAASLIRFGTDPTKIAQTRDLITQLAASKEVSSESEKAQGLWAVVAGNVPDGVTRLGKAAAQEPGDAQAAVYLGWAQLAAGQSAEAKATFSRALSADANHPGALFGTAQANAVLKDSAAALAALDKTLQANPRHPGALLLKTRLLLAAEKKQAAEQAINLASMAREFASRQEVSEIHTQLGSLHRLKGQNTSAREEYQNALKIDPKNIHAQIGLAHLFFSARKLNDAVTYFQQARNVDPKDLEAALGMARAYIDLGQPLKSQKTLKEILAHHPQAPEIMFLMGRTETALNNPEAAEANYKAAIKAKPTYFPPYRYLSLLYVKQNKPDEAQAILGQANSALPNSALVRDAEGLVNLALGNLNQAKAKFEEALRLDPTFNGALFDLGTALMRKGQLDEAKTRYLALYKKDSDYPGLAEKLGDLYIELGNFKEAALSYDRALQVDNPDTDTLLGAARAFTLAGQPDKSLKQTEIVLKTEPSSARAWALRAEARLSQGKLDDALVEIQQAVGRDRRIEYLEILAKVFEARLQREDASDTYAEALKQDPSRVDLRFRRAVIMVEGGSLRKGIKELQKVLKVRPNMAEAHLYIGVAYAETGKEAKALAAYRTAVARNPKLADAHFRIGQILFDTRQIAGAVAALRKAVQHGSDTDRWRADAHYLLGTAAASQGQKKIAIDALTHYLKIAPPGAALKKDAEKTLRKLGVRQKKPDDD